VSDVRVYPGRPSGCLTAPPSKSAAHRALICAALAQGESEIAPVSDSTDMAATLGVLAAMGQQAERDGKTVRFRGMPWVKQPVVLNCRESGSTLRFLLPVATALGLSATFLGEGRLPERPIGVLTEQLSRHGISVTGSGMPFSIDGKLTGGVFTLPGDVSSQFISGLLFALPLLMQDSEIRLTTPLESAAYVDMTLSALADAGIQIERTGDGFLIKGGQLYRPGRKTVEGDFSNAAFWLCAGVIGGTIAIDGLQEQSVQGDRAIVKLAQAFGASVSAQNGQITVESAPLRGIRIDAAPIPDLVPILAVTAAFAQGDTEIYNAARLRIKESDRLSAVSGLIRNLGGEAQEFPDWLIIRGSGGLRGGEVDGMNDHRIVMSAAIAALFCHESVVIRGAQAVRKSYPDFFEDLKRLGGRYDVI